MRMMKFTNSLGNSLTPKSLRSKIKENASACLIENQEYAHRNDPAADSKDHAHILAPPPAIFALVLIVGLLLHKYLSLGALLSSNSPAKMLGYFLFIIAGFIMMTTVRLMIKKKTALRPDRQTTTIISSGFFKYTRNPLYIALMLIYCGITVQVNSLWLLFLFPVLFITLDRGVVRNEEKYLEEKFGEEYLQYQKKVRRWL